MNFLEFFPLRNWFEVNLYILDREFLLLEIFLIRKLFYIEIFTDRLIHFFRIRV